MAGTSDSRKSAEVERAVDDVGLRGQGVGEHVTAAGAIDVGAVLARDARGGAVAFARDGGVDVGNGVAGSGRGALEVAVQRGCGA